MRDLRDKARAVARVSRDLAGLEVKWSEEEFLEYATAAAADNEFDALIGLAKQTEEGEREPEEKPRIPES